MSPEPYVHQVTQANDSQRSVLPCPALSKMGFKNVSVIIDGRLFLGNLVSAQSTRSLTERRITHIVSVCVEPIPAHHPQSGIRYLRVPVEDKPDEDLLFWMPHTCRFIDEALRSGGVVLVHGVHGLSRGATIMAAYRMIPQLLCVQL
jgi:dual specificity phosphatase 12